MRILLVSKLYYPWIGGVEKIVQQVAEGLNGRNDFEIDILCCDHQKRGGVEEIKKVKIYRAKSFGIFWGMPLSFDFFSLLRKLRNNYDIIDFHHPFPLGDLAIFLFPPKAKLVVHYHSDIVRQRIFEIFFRPFILNTLKRAQRILVSNPNLIKNSPYLKKFKEKCEVVPFGVDLKKFEEFDTEKVKKLKEKYGNFVLFVGRLNYYKGVQYLISAMREIDANLVIIGKGPEKKKLESQIEKLKLENKIFIFPPQPERDLINFYRASSLFVLPSIFKSEAFGIVLIEAMACGKPVVSTELKTGTSFINQDGITGFVVPPKDSESLRKAIQKILENKELAGNFGQNGLKRIKEVFSLEKMIRKVADIYKAI